MPRDFRPKDKKKPSRPHKGSAASVAPSRPTSSARTSAAPAPSSPAPPTRAVPLDSRKGPKEADADTDEDEEGNEDDLKEAIAALGGEEGDLDLISAKALKGKGKGKQDAEDQVDDVSV